MRPLGLFKMSVNDNRRRHLSARFRAAALSSLLLLNCSAAHADAPTPRAEGGVGASRVVPFEELLRRPARLRPGLEGKHPRVFFTKESLEALRGRARGGGRELWRESVRDLRALREEPPPPGSPMLDRSGVEQQPGDLSQYEIAYALAAAAFAYSVERDPRQLAAAKRWLHAVIRYEPWGYTFRTPNVDLPPAHLLYAVGLAYDALYHELDAAEREAVRKKLAHQARLMYEYHKYKPKKRYAYAQNHSFIPMTGLAVAAFALMGEEPEAEEWARLARAVYDRVLLTFDVDGYYYEGFHYAAFSLHWVVRYLDALEHATGEDLYPRMRDRFVPLKYYFAHSVLPGGRHAFDFGDTGRGAAERNSGRAARLQTGYEALYRIAARYGDAEAQGVADWLRRDMKTKTWEEHWAFHARDPALRPASIESLPTSYYFRDNGTAFWRSGWDAGATAFAFRAAPPEGHHVTRLLPLVPDWRLSTGHAHPDANSFIVYAKGSYLTGDTGYTGVKMASDHNTVLVDGRGQANDGRHEVFKDVPYGRLDRIRVAEVWSAPEYFYARGEAAAAYYPELGLKKFDRHFLFLAPDYFVVWDELAAEEPREFSWLLNAEREVERVAPSTFVLPNGGAALVVERVAPASASVEVAPQTVTTQGRPGSVEGGAQEQRGFQLVARTEGKAREAEFLHLLFPAGASGLRARPKVSALPGAARGLALEWPGGDREAVLLRGGVAEGLTHDGARAALRVSPGGGWRRVVLHTGTRLERGGRLVVGASRAATLALNASADGLFAGSVGAEVGTELTVSAARRPSRVTVGGRPVRFSFDTKKRAVSFGVPAGVSRVEAS